MDWIEIISQPWHWAFSGACIAAVMLLLTFLGRRFGLSSTFSVLCAWGGAGKRIPYFNINWREESWRLIFIAGAIAGGFVAGNFLSSPAPVALSQATVAHLAEWGIAYPSADTLRQGGFLPTTIFNFQSVGGIALALIGGFLVGFGSRYGEGCTSGHAISGLSHLRLPSLLTVIGFFIGGLIMTHLIMPFIFG